MRRQVMALIITLAILAPGIVAGTWVAYYVAHRKHTHSAPALLQPRVPAYALRHVGLDLHLPFRA